MRLSLTSAPLTTLTGLLALAPLTVAHSWVERTQRIAPNGTMVGVPGYERSHCVRGEIPEDSQVGKIIQATASTKLARANQLSPNATTTWPALSVAAGDWVAMQYQENGHVSLPQNQAGKPMNRGTVYIYGTTENDLTNVNFVDVHLKWTRDGKGGDGKGKLLATRNFDDGQCYQVNAGAISAARKAKYPVVDGDANQKIMGSDLWCQSDFQIPSDVTVGSTYTVIWLWDWPYMTTNDVAVSPPYIFGFGEGNSSVGIIATPEVYVSVIDFKIVDPCDDSLGSVKAPTCNSKSALTKSLAATFVKQTDFSAGGIGAQLLNPFQVAVDVSADINLVESTIYMAGQDGYTATQTFVDTAEPTTTATTKVTTTATTISTSTRAPSSAKAATTSATAPANVNNPADNNVVTVTVPETIVTVYVTAGGGAANSGAANAATGSVVATSSAATASSVATTDVPSATAQTGPPAVSPFMARKMRRARR